MRWDELAVAPPAISCLRWLKCRLAMVPVIGFLKTEH